MRPVAVVPQTSYNQQPRPAGTRMGKLCLVLTQKSQCQEQVSGPFPNLHVRSREVWTASGPKSTRMNPHSGGKPVRVPASGQPETCSVILGKLLAFSRPQQFCLCNGDGNRRNAAHKGCCTGQAHTCISSSSAMRSASVTCWLVRKALCPRNLSSKCCRALSTLVLLRFIFSSGT